MPDREKRKIMPSSNGGVFNDLNKRIKLIMRLLGDRRVSPWLKLLPIGSVAYLFIPDLVPFILDDAVIIWLGTYLFVELCPPDVVAEHQRALDNIISGEWHDTQGDVIDGEVIDSDYKDEK